MPKSLKDSIEIKKEIEKSMEPLLVHQERMQKVIDSVQVNMPNISLPTSAIQNIESPTTKIIKEREDTIKAITDSVVKKYAFTNSLENRMIESMSMSLQMFSKSVTKLLTTSINSIANNMSSILSEAIKMNSPAIRWIQSIDYSPMRTFLENLNFDYSILKKNRELNQIYLITMYECKWFPYAGWTADISLMSEVSNIIATSRGKSKRREQRVDKVILKYYNHQEIKKIKRVWKNSDLESHIKKILGQAIEAHIRGEYALTIACLATMWEGLIHHKLNIKGRYSQKKTKQDFAKLISENNFEPIFSDFYENLIVSQCDTFEDVIDGVPNRNGISHSKYKKYPNKKASLNAILLTDFIIGLKPKFEIED